MDESIMNLPPYALAEVSIGDELLNARPVEWDREIVDGEGRDVDGEFAIATKYETACPGCGDSIAFKTGMLAIKCPYCGVGEDEFTEVYESPFHDPGVYGDPIDSPPEVDGMTNEEITQAVEDAIDEEGVDDPAPNIDEYEKHDIEAEISSLIDKQSNKSSIQFEEELGEET